MSLSEIGFYVACRFKERKVQESLEFIWNREETSNTNFELFFYRQNFSDVIMHKLMLR